MAPTGMIEDHHGLTWGSIGYQHLDEALKEGNAVLASSLSSLADRLSAPKAAPGSTVVVFNPCNWSRTSLARTGKIYIKHLRGKQVSIENSASETVPFQLERTENDADGNLAMVDVTFLAEDIACVGYDTYRLKFTTESVDSPKTR
jgi:hypothetical protein